MPEIATPFKLTLTHIQGLMKRSSAGLVTESEDSQWMFCISHYGPFTGSRRDGEMLNEGWVYYCPQFIIEAGEVKVMLHRIMTAMSPNDVVCALHRVFQFPQCFANREWEEIEANVELFDPFDRKRKLVTLQSWVKDAFRLDGLELYDSAVDTFCKEIKEAFVTTVSADINLSWFTGIHIVDKYCKLEDTSHSCMTGNHSNRTELWSTNSKQVALCVIKDGDEEFARVLCFRPLGSIERSDDEVPAGAGWYFSRIYPIMRGQRDRTEEAAAYLRRIGVQPIANAQQDSCVPLIVTNQAPYFDMGSVMAEGGYEAGETCYWVPKRGWRPDFIPCYYGPIENNEHGTAFGRDADGDESPWCSNCESSCDELIDVGDHEVCRGCLENGNYVMLYNGGYCDSGDALEIVSRANTSSGDYEHNDNETISHRGRTHTNVESYDGTQVFAPLDECIDVNDKNIWIEDPETQTFETVLNQYTFSGGYAKVSPIPQPRMERSVDCVTIAGVGGPVRCIRVGPDGLPKFYCDDQWTKANPIFYEKCNIVLWNDKEYKYRALDNGWVAYDDAGTIVLSTTTFIRKVGDKVGDIPIIAVAISKVQISPRSFMWTFATHTADTRTPAANVPFNNNAVLHMVNTSGYEVRGYGWLDEMMEAQLDRHSRHLIIRPERLLHNSYVESISEIVGIGDHMVLMNSGTPVYIAISGANLPHIVDKPTTAYVFVGLGTHRTTTSMGIYPFDISTHTAVVDAMYAILQDTSITTMQTLSDAIARKMIRGHL